MEMTSDQAQLQDLVLLVLNPRVLLPCH
jgi:hypothetical protein